MNANPHRGCGILKRTHQFVLIGSTLASTWLGMMVVHELGHVIGAWTSGGEVSRVNLPLLGFSSTEMSHIPHPLWAVWAGPVFGAFAPLVAWSIAFRLKASWEYLLRFFAGFCLLANGAYLAVGSFDGIADAGNLLDLGASPWQLWLFGGLCFPLAFVLWHRQGSKFGFGKAKGSVNQRHAYVMLGLLTARVLVEVMVLIA